MSSNKNVVHFAAGAVTSLLIVFVYFWLNEKTTQTTRKKVVMFGDSLTQHGFNAEDGWVASMADWWTCRVDVINRGFSGYNTKWALKMVDSVVIAEKPDLVFVFFGANDAVDPKEMQHVSLPTYRSNMIKIITKLKAAMPSVPVVVISPPPIWEPGRSQRNREKGGDGFIDRTNERTRTYAVVCREISEKLNLPFLDLWTLLEGPSDNRAVYFYDGLHLNAKGQKALSKALIGLIERKLPNWVPSALPLQMPEFAPASKDPFFKRL